MTSPEKFRAVAFAIVGIVGSIASILGIVFAFQAHYAAKESNVVLDGLTKAASESKDVLARLTELVPTRIPVFLAVSLGDDESESWWGRGLREGVGLMNLSLQPFSKNDRVYQLTLFVEPDKNDPRATAERIVALPVVKEAPVAFVIGPVSSTQANKIGSIYSDVGNIVHILPTTTSAELLNGKKRTFQMSPDNEMAIEAGTKCFKTGVVYAVCDDDTQVSEVDSNPYYSSVLCKTLKDMIKHNRLGEVTKTTGSLLKVSIAGKVPPELGGIFYAGSFRGVEDLLRTLHASPEWRSVPILLTDASARGLSNDVGQRAIPENTYLLFQGRPLGTISFGAAREQQMVLAAGAPELHSPVSAVAIGYDAVKLIVHALIVSDSMTGDSVAKTMREFNVQGAAMTYDFDDGGQNVAGNWHVYSVPSSGWDYKPVQACSVAGVPMHRTEAP